MKTDKYELKLGDCLELLRGMPDNSVDSIVTDPPYGLGKEPDALKMLTDWIETGHHDVKGRGFMGKEWDAFVPQPQVWHECLRVLKPGGHLLAFAGTRTQDLMTLGLRLAGFEIRDMVAWVYGSGFPKSLNVQQAINKAARGCPQGTADPSSPNHGKFKGGCSEDNAEGRGFGAGAGAFMQEQGAARGDDEGEWQGWGTALKPALEPITLARKPLEGTVAANVLKWHTGALNIDGCRVETSENLNGGAYAKDGSDRHDGAKNWRYKREGGAGEFQQPQGRWPANLIHDGSDEVLVGFPDSKGQQGDLKGHGKNRKSPNGCFGEMAPAADHQRRGDSGSAARFFFQAKYEKDDLLLCGAKTKIEAWQGQNPTPSTADIAGHPSSLREALESIAQKVAATWPNLVGILSSDSTNPSTSVTANEFETLCATVTTAMTSIGSGFSQESQQEKHTPCNSLVKCVATQKQTGITTITASLLRSDGFAESATLTITSLNTGLGGAASRFKYCAKTSKADRDKGCGDLPEHQEGLQLPRGKCPECGTWKNAGEVKCKCGDEWEMTSNPPPKARNNHPTVKPTDLMRYLCRLITPPGGVILDPYMGSGSTGKAALAEDFRFIGIERDENYFAICNERIRRAYVDSYEI